MVAWGWLLAGLCNALFGLVQYLGWTDEARGLAFGFLRQRNNFATLCNIALIALIYLWHQKQIHKVWALASGLLLVAGLAATTSRAGLLGLAALGLLCARKKICAALPLCLCLRMDFAQRSCPCLVV